MLNDHHSKPRGIRAARKLLTRHRNQRWADKEYNKAHTTATYRAKPMGNASHAKGIVVEKVYVSLQRSFRCCLHAVSS